MCILSKTLPLVFHRTRLEPRVLPWQQHGRCHSVSFMLYIAGAKFEEHFFNISRVILDFECCAVFVVSALTSSLLSFAWQKTWISPRRKKICQKEKRYSSLLWKAFEIGSNYLFTSEAASILKHRSFKTVSKRMIRNLLILLFFPSIYKWTSKKRVWWRCKRVRPSKESSYLWICSWYFASKAQPK